MAIVGYARVSPEDQSTEGQILDLQKFGCTEIFRENASGADRNRPQLKAVLGRVREAVRWSSSGSLPWPFFSRCHRFSKTALCSSYSCLGMAPRCQRLNTCLSFMIVAGSATLVLCVSFLTMATASTQRYVRYSPFS